MASSINPLTSQSNALAALTGASSNSKSATSASTASATGGTGNLANESTFLTLLVAQLQNQDPSQPADGMQFVTQLAQFTTLEQNLAMRTDLDSINSKVGATAAAAPASTTTPANSNPTGA